MIIIWTLFLGYEIIFTGFLKIVRLNALASSVGCILRDAQIYMELLSLSERQEREKEFKFVKSIKLNDWINMNNYHCVYLSSAESHH